MLLYLALSKSTIGTLPPPPPPPPPEKSYSLGLLRGSCTPSFWTLGSTSCTFQSSKVEATTAKYRARQYNLISSDSKTTTSFLRGICVQHVADSCFTMQVARHTIPTAQQTHTHAHAHAHPHPHPHPPRISTPTPTPTHTHTHTPTFTPSYYGMIPVKICLSQ